MMKLPALLLNDGDVFAPEPRGRGSVLLVDGRIAAVGPVGPGEAARAADALGLALEGIDARGMALVPGFIDPHEHLLGPSGEEGFSSRGPEIFCVELIEGGITTVVGTLGTDNTMRRPVELLAKVKALSEEGLTALMYSGGYSIPPATITGSLRNDVLFVDPVIGAGEVAISDARAVQPSARELASLIIETRVGGMLARKAGVTHIHVGPGDARLRPVMDAIHEFGLDPGAIYPTHITRSDALFRDAIALARRGCPVDIDTSDEDLPRWLDAYEHEQGPFDRLTISTDAGSSSPGRLRAQLVAAVGEGWTVADLLPLVTANPARALRLPSKGALAPGCDADVIALDPATSLEPVHVVARGRVVMRAGRIVNQPNFLKGSDREVTLHGEEA